MKENFIALVDGNNFFASCETIKNPALKGKPVCVLSNNDGCVIARSNEAKKLGIAMGMPYFIAKKSYPEAIYLSADFATYHTYSRRMKDFLKNFSDKIDEYSIDEAFIDVTGTDKVFRLSYLEIAKKIKEETEAATGVSVSVGIANTKTLAKLASHRAKHSLGYYFIDKKSIDSELHGINVEEIWGIGKNIARELRKFGIFYANEILLKDDNFFKTQFGKKGLELKYELEGKSVIPVTGITEDPKSIQHTRAFPEFSKDINYIREELNLHLHGVCKKLRSYDFNAKRFYVMLRTKEFRVYFREIFIPEGTNSEILLANKISEVLREMFINGVIYRASGFGASEFESCHKLQTCLFENIENTKTAAIGKVMDKLEGKFGNYVIAAGVNGIKSLNEKHKRKSELKNNM